MSVVLLLARLSHVVFAMWFVAGLAGRTYSLHEARRSDEIGIVARLSRLAGGFDRYFVIPGFGAALVLGLLTAWLGGYPLLGFLQGSSTNWVLLTLVLVAGVMVLVHTVFIPSGKVFDSAMRNALAAGTVTTELTAALNSNRVAWAHRLEFILVAAIVVLMIAKPF